MHVQVGNLLLDRLHALQGKHDIIGDVRGQGLMLGIEMVKDRDSKQPAAAETAQVRASDNEPTPASCLATVRSIRGQTDGASRALCGHLCMCNGPTAAQLSVSSKMFIGCRSIGDSLPILSAGKAVSVVGVLTGDNCLQQPHVVSNVETWWCAGYGAAAAARCADWKGRPAWERFPDQAAHVYHHRGCRIPD